jgi:hypothetical protein
MAASYPSIIPPMAGGAIISGISATMASAVSSGLATELAFSTARRDADLKHRTRPGDVVARQVTQRGAASA